MKRFFHIVLALVLVCAMLTAPACKKKSGTPESPELGPSVVTNGTSHFLIKADNSLWAWGGNSTGCLGDGTQNDRGTPVHILDSVAQVITDGACTYAIKTDGALFAWGSNDAETSFLGDGTSERRLSPVRILEDVYSVHPMDGRTFAITFNGDLYAWGSNENGALGDGTLQNRLSPVKIAEDVSAVSGSMFIKKDGSLWYIGTYSQTQDPKLTNRSNKPMKMLEGIASFEGGYVLTADGRLGFVNADEDGKLALTVVAENVKSAIPVNSGRDHFILKNDGSLWGVGENTNGVLGDGTTECREEPVRIMDGVASVSAGAWHDEDYGYQYVFVITTDGELFSWGEDFCGALGRATSSWPELSPAIAAENVASVVSDGWSTFIMKKDGTLHACGYNGDGLLIGHPIDRARLGDGSTENRHEFVKILDKVNSVYHKLSIEFCEDDDGEDYFVDYSRSFALMADGTLMGWGYNADGLLGCGGTETALSPMVITDGLRMP